MKKQIISCAAVLAMLGTAVCVPESSISCLTTLSLHTAAEETDTPDDAATESQVYDTSTLTLGTKLSQGDTLHYDKQNVGVAISSMPKAIMTLHLFLEDYVLPLMPRLSESLRSPSILPRQWTALLIPMYEPFPTGTPSTEIRTSSATTTSSTTGCCRYFSHPIMTSTSGQAPFG
ncbi:MAG: hypothetical protein ACLR5S_08885 [Ruminococcus sp.]